VFSPVIAPRQDGAHNVDLNLAYTVTESSNMRYVPNLLAGSAPDATCALFDEMPGAHKVFGEMPGAHLMFTEEEGTTYMNDLIRGDVTGVGSEDAQAYDNEIEETIEVVDADTDKTLGKRKLRVGAAG
jgi:hypothetical protein